MKSQWTDSPPPGGGGGGGLQVRMPPLTPIVGKLIKLNAGIYLFTFVLGLFPSTHLIARWLEVWGGVTPRLWIDLFPFVPVWQIFTWGFLHSSAITHVLFNMLFLYMMGTALESMIGSRRFLVAYVSTLLVSGVGTLFLGLGEEALGYGTGPVPWQGMVPTIGASGAVLGVVIAVAAMRPREMIIVFIFPMTLKVFAFIIVGLDIFNLLSSLGARSAGESGSNVANFAHLVGAGWGYLLVRKGWIYRDPLETLQVKQAEHRARREASDRERLDELLGRIHKQGIGTLSKSEREFMKRVSKRD